MDKELLENAEMLDRFNYEFLTKFYERKRENLYTSLYNFAIQFAYDESLNNSEQRVAYAIANPWFSSERELMLKFHMRSFLEKISKEQPLIQFTEFTSMLIETINQFSKQAYKGEKELFADKYKSVTPHLCIFAAPNFTEEVSVLALTENASVDGIHWEILNSFSYNVDTPYNLGLEIEEESAMRGLKIPKVLVSDYGDNLIPQNSSISEWLEMQRKDSNLRNVYKWLMEL